jgi:hypothetical protein
MATQPFTFGCEEASNMRRALSVLGLSLTLGGLAATPIAAMQASIDPAFSDTILFTLGYPTIEIEVGPGGLQAPDSLEAGFYHVTLEAEEADDLAYVNFVQPPAGLDHDTMVEQMLEAGAGDVVREGWVFAGGTNTPNPGEPATFVIELKEGEYQVAASYYTAEENGADEVMVMEALTVTPQVNDAIYEAPEADVVLESTDDLQYIVTPGDVPAGPQVWEIANTGEHHSHHVVMFGVPDGTTSQDIIDEFNAMMSGTPTASPSIMDAFVWTGYAALQSGGQTTWAEFDLKPGSYALVCFIMEEGVYRPHLLDGMVTVFTVA